jgi:hypothetical protein
MQASASSHKVRALALLDGIEHTQADSSAIAIAGDFFMCSGAPPGITFGDAPDRTIPEKAGRVCALGYKAPPRWERATPVALIGCAIDEEAQLELRAPSEKGPSLRSG